MSLLDTLAPLRTHGHARTTGLDDVTLLDFAARDPQLVEAAAAAAAEYASIRAEFPALLDLDENAQAQQVRGAIDAVLAGHAPSSDQKPSIGCSIKWKA